MKNNSNINSLENQLLEAAKDGNLEAIESLLSKGLSVDTKDENGHTILHHAVVNDHKNIVASLLKKNINIDEKDNWGLTAFHFAVEVNKDQSSKIIDLLLENGANIDANDN